MKNQRVFKDNRGQIERICENADVIRVISNKGSRRADHFHKTTGHFCYVTKGNIKYFERPVGSNDKATVKIYNVGEMVWTGPMIEHLMRFDDFEENEFLCFSTGKRDQSSYEEDLVRLNYKLDEI